MGRGGFRTARFHICTALVFGAFVVVGVRLYFLQVVQAAEVVARENPARERLIEVAAKRGDILDRRGNLLAGTRSRIQVGMDPWFVTEAQVPLWGELAEILGIDESAVRTAAARRERVNAQGEIRRNRWVPLGEVGEDEFARIQEMNLRGIYGNRRYERFYPGQQLAAHIIGYLNREETPVMGVEEAMDFFLRGQSGWKEISVDGRRREMVAFRGRQVPSRHGLDVVLTLDLVAQSIVESAMARLVEELQPESVAIIVSRPRTGEILALANYPNFNPNEFWRFPLAAQRNRALSDQFEPGSTFKIVPIAAALEEGLLHRETLIDCDITHKEYAGVRIPLPNDTRPLGEVSLHRALQRSSNRAAAQIGIQLGKERLYDYSRAMGFGQRVDWPLRGAAAGSLLPPRQWDGYAISRVPTGYAVAATPMQIHLAMATIANDGIYVAPRILQSVVDPLTGREIPLGREERRTVFSELTARDMKVMLRDVVTPQGTGNRAAIEGYQVAGKTGTARKLIDGRYSHSHHLASFSGFFPARNPELVITVMIDNPQTRGAAYGGAVAAPAFREIGERLIPHLSIRKPEEWTPFIVSRDSFQ